MTNTDRKPRLVQIGKFYPPERGGIETFTELLAIGVAARGLASEVVVFTRGKTVEETIDGVIIDRSHAAITLSSQPLSLRWLWQSIRRMRGADVVLLHYPNVLAIAVLPFTRARVVTYWHSDIVNKGVAGRVVGIAERYLLRRSNLVLASTRAYAQASPRLRRLGNKLGVLAIGINDVAETVASAMPTAIARFIGGENARLVLAVGRLVPYKGFDVLIRAAVGMPTNTRIVIAGTGPEEAALERLIDELGVRDRVMLAGRLEDEALQALFRTAAVYAMSSTKRSEAYAIVQVEAMAHGVPIVATAIPGSGVPEVSGHGATGAMVPVGDPEALGLALARVMAAPDDHLRRLARARFETLFTAERMVDEAIPILFAEAASPSTPLRLG